MIIVALWVFCCVRMSVVSVVISVCACVYIFSVLLLLMFLCLCLCTVHLSFSVKICLSVSHSFISWHSIEWPCPWLWRHAYVHGRFAPPFLIAFFNSARADLYKNQHHILLCILMWQSWNLWNYRLSLCVCVRAASKDWLSWISRRIKAHGHRFSRYIYNWRLEYPHRFTWFCHDQWHVRFAGMPSIQISFAV